MWNRIWGIFKKRGSENQSNQTTECVQSPESVRSEQISDTPLPKTAPTSWEMEENNQEKCFEDQLMDLQLALLQDCLDYVHQRNESAEKLFLWWGASNYSWDFNLFSQKNHKITRILTQHKDVLKLFSKGIAYVQEICALCNEHGRPFPVEARLTFDVETERLDNVYFYDKDHFKYTECGPIDFFHEWIEEEKKKLQA